MKNKRGPFGRRRGGGGGFTHTKGTSPCAAACPGPSAQGPWGWASPFACPTEKHIFFCFEVNCSCTRGGACHALVLPSFLCLQRGWREGALLLCSLNWDANQQGGVKEPFPITAHLRPGSSHAAAGWVCSHPGEIQQGREGMRHGANLGLRSWCGQLGDLTTFPPWAAPLQDEASRYGGSSTRPQIQPSKACKGASNLFICLTSAFVASLLEDFYSVCLPKKHEDIFFLTCWQVRAAGPAQEITQEQHHEMIFLPAKIMNTLYGHRKRGELQELELGTLCLGSCGSAGRQSQHLQHLPA